MKRTLMLAALTFATTFGGVAAAQVPPGIANAPKRVEVREQREDRWDYKQLQTLSHRFDATIQQRWLNRGEVRAIDQQLQKYLALELRETRAELDDAKSDRSRIVKGPRVFRDRGDVREAKQEVREESQALKQTRSIARDLGKVYGKYDRKSLKVRKAAFDGLLKLAKAELRDGR